LLLTCHVTVLLFWLTLLWLLWAPSSQLLRGAIVYLVPIISQPVVPVLSALSFTWWLVQVDPRHELFAEVRELYPNDFPSAAEHVRLSVCVPELSFDELTVLVPEKAKIKYLERDPEAAVIEEQTSILQSERGSVWHQAEAELAPYHYGWGSQQAPLPPADESAESIALHAFFLPDKAVDEDVGRAYLSRNQCQNVQGIPRVTVETDRVQPPSDVALDRFALRVNDHSQQELAVTDLTEGGIEPGGDARKGDNERRHPQRIYQAHWLEREVGTANTDNIETFELIDEAPLHVAQQRVFPPVGAGFSSQRRADASALPLRSQRLQETYRVATAVETLPLRSEMLSGESQTPSITAAVTALSAMRRIARRSFGSPSESPRMTMSHPTQDIEEPIQEIEEPFDFESEWCLRPLK
jgi:hypothetical protein